VVQHGRLGRAGRSGVVMGGDGVHQLGEHVALERLGPRLEQADAELDVAEEPALVGRPKVRRPPELHRAAGVVEQSRRHEQVAPQPWVDLSRVAADRGHRHGVLEQSAGVVVMDFGARRQLTQSGAEELVAEEAADQLI
jgi:hypothetical protein